MNDCHFCGMPLQGACVPFGEAAWIHADSSECRPCAVCGDVVEGTAVITDHGYEHLAHRDAS